MSGFMTDEDFVYACPTCGADVETCAMDQDLREVYPVEEMWPGGPLFEDRGASPVSLAKDGPPRTTFGPCGCVIVGQYTITGHRRASA